jgi:hypothetical protein
MVFRMKGKKIDNLPDILYNENEPGRPDDNAPITVLDDFMTIILHRTADLTNCLVYSWMNTYHLTLM